MTRLAERWHPTQRMTSKVSLIAFVLLCASFLLYPIQYSYAFSQLESLQVIYQPILFSLLYAAWILTGLVTLRRNTGASIQIGIVSLFSVMSGVIVLRMAPLGTDHTYAITYFATSYLNSVHHVPTPPPPNVLYLEYPGIMILTSISSSLLDLSLITTGGFLLVVIFLTVGWAIFLLTKRLTKDTQISFLSLPLLFAFSLESGNLLLFFPATLGVCFLSMALVSIVRQQQVKGRMLVEVLIFYSAMVITHFYDPINFIFVLAILALGRNNGARKYWGMGFLAITVVSFLSYFGFAASSFFNSIVVQSVDATTSLLSGHLPQYFIQVVSSNTFGIPIWAAATKYLDLGLTSVVGIVIILWSFLSHPLKRKRESDEFARFRSAGLGMLIVGILIFIVAFPSGGTIAGLDLGLQWIALITIPILLLAVSRKPKVVLIFVVLILAFSGPSLLYFVTPQVSTITVYPSNLAAASFLVAYTPSVSVHVLIDGKNSGVVGMLDPLFTPDYYSIPLQSFIPSSSVVNFVDISYSYYQLHIYGTAVNYSSVYAANVVFSAPRIYILPAKSA